MTHIYNFPLSDTLNNKFDSGRLRSEIEAPSSNVITQLELPPNVTVINGVNTLYITFKAEFSNPTSEYAALEDIVANHTGEPLEVVDSVQISNIPEVVPRKPILPRRAYAFSHNWCDKTTWYWMSKEKIDYPIGVGDGFTKEFVLEADYPVIEGGRGKITDDHRLLDPNGNDYCVHIKVGTATGGYTTLTEREPFEDSGGDFWIDYDNPDTEGTKIYFANAPASGDDILATYHYCDTDMPGHSAWYFQPPSGKKWVIDHVEAQFTDDVELTDTIIYQAWVNHPTYGWIPVPGEEELRYYAAHNYDDYVRGALPSAPAWGGPGKRGRQASGRVIQWSYDSSIVLNSSQGVAVRVWCRHDRAQIGSRVTITIYAMEEDE